MGRSEGFHEDFKRDDEVGRSSDRAFGLTVGGILAIVGAARIWLVGATATNLVLLGLGGALIVLGLAAPASLALPARLWFRLGEVLAKVVNPVVLGLVFFSTVTPTGWLLRAIGAKPLRLERDPNATSYWIEREPPGPSPESIRHQF